MHSTDGDPGWLAYEPTEQFTRVFDIGSRTVRYPEQASQQICGDYPSEPFALSSSAASSRNAIPLLVGNLDRALVGDHRSAGLRDAAENVEAGTEGTCDLTVGLGIPALVVRIGLTGRKDPGLPSVRR